tara:strand:- start:3616 stop:4539 length:924 start_codon:yes stop_codon:yes gene_type:complete
LGELIKHLKPNFFIPGAAKSGTTTLHDILNTHHEISMSSVKEPGYWKNKNFNEFGRTEILNYQNLFDNTKKFKGESSTAYMYFDRFLNNVTNNYEIPPKFIFILRNPIDRYISHVNWMKGLGLEKNKLEEIINVRAEFNFKEYYDYPKYYYEFGLYFRWIKRFLNDFGKENIKIITFERLLKNKLSTVNECFDFIGVSPLNEIKEIKSNKTKEIVFPTAYHFIRKSISGKTKYTKIGKYFLPKKIRRIIKGLIKIVIKNWISIESKKEKVSNRHRRILKEKYYEDVIALKNELNYDFPEWEDFKNNQ